MTSAPEPALARWSRRAITIPAALALSVSLTLLTLLIAPPSLLIDAALGRRAATARFVAALAWVAIMEVLGVAAALALWLARAGIDADFRLQCWWTQTLFSASSRVLGVRFEVEPIAELAGHPRPILLLVRHASALDTLFPAVTVAIPHRIRLRYLLKQPLAWDPCIDVLGRRLENVFVRRGHDLADIRALARDLGPGLGAVVFPEGTRFSRERQQAALARLGAHGDPEALRAAQQLRHVLPPQPGGVLALLDGAPDADVVFLAHTGLEDARTLADLWSGKLIGRTVRARSWLVPRAQVPADAAGRVRWLNAEWARVDAWIDQQRHLTDHAAHATAPA